MDLPDTDGRQKGRFVLFGSEEQTERKVSWIPINLSDRLTS